MKFKIQAGAEIEVMTPAEMRSELGAWLGEIRRGVKFVRRSMFDTVDNGAVTMGPEQGLGPEPGFTWAVTRINVTGLQNAEIQPVTINDDSFHNLVGMFGAGTAATRVYSPTGCILLGGDRLVSNNTGLTNGRIIVVSIQAVEVPDQIAWQLL